MEGGIRLNKYHDASFVPHSSSSLIVYGPHDLVWYRVSTTSCILSELMIDLPEHLFWKQVLRGLSGIMSIVILSICCLLVETWVHGYFRSCNRQFRKLSVGAKILEIFRQQRSTSNLE